MKIDSEIPLMRLHRTVATAKLHPSSMPSSGIGSRSIARYVSKLHREMVFLTKGETLSIILEFRNVG